MMWLFNVILGLLALVACLGALAAYRSPKVNGPEAVNAMRAVRAGVWGMLVLAMAALGASTQQPPIEGVALAILTVLAFADAASYTERMGELLRSELA